MANNIIYVIVSTHSSLSSLACQRKKTKGRFTLQIRTNSTISIVIVCMLHRI